MNQLATFDNEWKYFVGLCDRLPSGVSVSDACNLVGLSEYSSQAQHIISDLIKEWRNSVSKSLLHGASNLTIGTAPKAGKPIFVDLLHQTRFLVMARAFVRSKSIVQNGKVVPFGREPALTIDASSSKKLNDLIRLLYLYWFLNIKKEVKLPKVLYRGIRAGNLYGHKTFEPLISKIWKLDKSHEAKRKECIDLLVRFICEKKLHQLLDGKFLSFSAALPIAKYFSNNEGFVLCVDPKKVEIVTSELHDETLAGREPLYGRLEREYICRIPENYDFTQQNIIMNDLDYFVAERNPLCVELFSHDTTRAVYEIDGISIEARYRWKNNNQGSINFVFEDDWEALSRGMFKKRYGFDPMPTEANLSQITNFRLQKTSDIFKKKWQDF